MMSRSHRRTLARYGFALFVTALAIIIRAPLGSLLGADVPFILFFPTVTLAAWYGGFGPGLLATALSALGALVLYIEPASFWAGTNVRDASRLLLFVAGSTFISWICGSLRAAHGQARELVSSREQLLASEQRARAGAEKQQQQMTTILESMTDGFAAFDAEWRYTYLNARTEELLGMKREELLGKNVWEIFPEAQETEFEKQARKAIAEQTTVSYEEFMPSVGKWFNVRVYPSPDGSHAVYFQDVTDRRRAAEEVRQNQERYRRAAEAGKVGVWELNLDTNELYLAPNLKAMLGYSDAELPDNLDAWCQIVHPEDKERTLAATRAHLEGETPTYETEVRRRHKDGHYQWFLAQGVAERDEQGRAFKLIGSDTEITERKRAEDERARLALQVEGQRQHLQAMLSSVPGIVWEAWGVPDVGYQRIDFVSDYVETLLGYTVEEWISTPNFWLTIVHPEDAERAAREAVEIYQSGTGGTSRFRWVAKGGRVVWVEAQSVVICDEAGRPVGMRGVTLDITERKQKESNERFLSEASTTLASSLDYETTLSTLARLAVPHFADWCSVDIVGDDGAVNRLAVAHVDPAKVAWGHELQKRFPPDPNEPRGVHNVLRTGESEFYPDIPDEMLAAAARDAEHLAVMREIGFRSAMLVPLKARERTLGVLTFVNTETRRHHTHEDLALAENLASRAALAIDNARLFRAEQQTREAAVRTSDMLMRLQAVSSALSQALTPPQVVAAVVEQALHSLGAHAGTVVVMTEGGTELELVGTVGFPQELVEKWKRFSIDQRVPIADAVRTKTPVIVEAIDDWQERYPALGPLASVTGSRALTAFPLTVEGRTIGAMGLSFPRAQRFSEDDRAFLLALSQQCAQALERARLYETEQRLRAEAETANRLKDEFLATVSHELRTPLTAIVGWSNMLRNNTFDANATARALATIERNAKAQTQIIEDLLDVSRIITGKLRLDARAIELDAIIQTALDGVRPAAETRDIRIDAELDPGVGTIWGDPARLQQVMWNLLSNAVKFTPRGGRVHVRLARVESHVRISVSDTGQGIKPDFLPFVFERFRQADGGISRLHGGLGLGLAIVRHLVEMHGGQVHAESAGEGLGSTFTVELPVLSKPSVERESQASASAFVAASSAATTNDGAPSLHNLRILVVDDEADARHMLAAIVEQSGARVRSASSAREAIEALGEFKPHVLVSDIGMPGEDGYSLIRRVRALTPDEGGRIPAIALTAYAREEDRLRALLAGYQIHVAKPVNPGELVAVVAGLAGMSEPK